MRALPYQTAVPAPPDCIWTAWARPPMDPIYANGAVAAVPTSSGRNNDTLKLQALNICHVQ
ncbi:MAG TPA: hypothetical protein VHY08_29445 [Bacillota bacterium]|nr:hypothetical protein [Bacillota bacterium]